MLDANEELVYNVPVATDKEERNKEKHKASESVKKSRTAKKKMKKVLDKVSELRYNGVTQTKEREFQVITKGCHIPLLNLMRMPIISRQ